MQPVSLPIQWLRLAPEPRRPTCERREVTGRSNTPCPVSRQKSAHASDQNRFAKKEQPPEFK